MGYKTIHIMNKNTINRVNKTSEGTLNSIKKYKKAHPEIVKKVNDKYQATKREFEVFRKILLNE